MGGGNDPNALITAAARRDRTLRVLNAALEAGVKRVVLTSSMAACRPAKPQPRAFDESDWTDPDQPGLADYRKSKVLAERAAWDLMAGKATELSTVLPGAVFGPVLSKDQGGSVQIIRGLIAGKPPALPRLAFNIIDVRDLAKLHVEAMVNPAAAGRALHRHRRHRSGTAEIGTGACANGLGEAGARRSPPARCPTWRRGCWACSIRRCGRCCRCWA